MRAETSLPHLPRTNRTFLRMNGSGSLPAGLTDAGNLALVSQLTEADTADAVVAKVSMGTAADLAAVVLTSRVLCRSLLLQNH